MNRPLLVVVHEATRTGTPRAMLDYLRYLRSHRAFPITIRVLTPGPLSDEFAAISDTPDDGRAPAAVLVLSSGAAGMLTGVDPSVPCAVYVHEDEEAFELLPAEARAALVGRADIVLCVSSSSEVGLRSIGVDPGRLLILPPAIPRRDRPSEAQVVAARDVLRGGDGGGGGVAIVACGEAVWHKGADLFVELAVALRGRSPDGIHLSWIGRRSRSLARVLDHDARQAGVDHLISWVGEVVDPLALLAAADVVVMPSRRDAQPLVPFEAALGGTPTAAFAVGGLRELGAHGAIATAPYPDAASLADEVGSLLASPDRGVELVGYALRLAEERHIDVLGPRFVDSVDRLLGMVVAGHVPTEELP